VPHQFSKQLEVTVHTAYEEHPVSHETHCDAYPGSDGQLAEKPDEVSVDGKVERGPRGENSSGDHRHCRLDGRIGG
jgi:hypothetical protein